jgi:predicted metal-dependent RNase
MDYIQSGFDSFMERSIGIGEPTMTTLEGVSAMVSSGDINFDASQISGSLGDKIQVGGRNIIIDGKNGRIVLNDGQVDRLVLGEFE